MSIFYFLTNFSEKNIKLRNILSLTLEIEKVFGEKIETILVFVLVVSNLTLSSKKLAKSKKKMLSGFGRNNLKKI